ncbi:hypothetical protein C8J57DRAFT_1227920 [Mycena rebaudengoi]|nr:hypothetical protein C8J57DRAFT_1227920 [Mycena rebaudengoi]
MPATHHPLATQLVETLKIMDTDTPNLGPEDNASFRETIHQLYETVDEDEMDVIHASFCARFLPALVDAYKSVPDLLGPYTTMLRVVSSSGYFAKFMRGALGSDIYTIHAERFVEMKLSADIDFEAMESAVIMLVFLIVYSDHYHRTIPPLAEPLKEKLTAKMVTLQNHYGPKLKQVAVRRGQVASRRARLLESIVRNAGDHPLLAPFPIAFSSSPFGEQAAHVLAPLWLMRRPGCCHVLDVVGDDTNHDAEICFKNRKNISGYAVHI